MSLNITSYRCCSSKLGTILDTKLRKTGIAWGQPAYILVAHWNPPALARHAVSPRSPSAINLPEDTEDLIDIGEMQTFKLLLQP